MLGSGILPFLVCVWSVRRAGAGALDWNHWTAHAEVWRAQRAQRRNSRSIRAFHPCSFRPIRVIRDKAVRPGPQSSAPSAVLWHFSAWAVEPCSGCTIA